MLQFMKTKILIPLVILGALVAFFSFRYASGSSSENSNPRQTLILEAVMKTIQEGHYSPRPVDDSFSNRIFHKILDNLDYDKRFFTAQDMKKLEPFHYKIDDEIKEGSLQFFDTLSALFTKRIKDTEGFYKEALSKPFSFSGNETIQLNGEKLNYVADDAALKNRWHSYLKYRVLAKYVDLKQEQDSSKDKTLKRKTDAELEVAARESVRKNQEFFFKRLNKIKEEDRFSLFINSITAAEDPHTDYFPPVDKQRFNEAMSGSFQGIGAQLREEEGKIKVVAIITGSPSWKQGELKANDEILKVAQGSAEPVDIQGFEIDDVVKIIRGKKGTEVKLTVKKIDGSQKIIPIVRGDVLMEETFAKSAIIESDKGPVGYIFLPEFYADFQHANGRRSATDIAAEVEKLKNANVTGIILDLRGNGGGSLGDVVDIAGLFIDKGPIVQVKSSDNAPQIQNDRYSGTLYDGPLAIMVNQGSASASEIMAAAMQDYKRAIIVGSPTFGKGTVQRVIDLAEMVTMSDRIAAKGGHINVDSIGAVKITMQKFYRINGGSTQLRGVTPDVQLPDPYQHLDLGERRDKSALPWDEIPKANYQIVANAVNVSEIEALSKKRVFANPTFALIEQNSLRLKQQEEDNTYVLSETAYRKKLEEANALSRKMEELANKASALKLSNAKEDLPRINLDSSNITKNKAWLEALQKDIYLSETVHIVNDISKNQTNNGTGMK